jgi:hypothetical protein
MKIFSKLPYCFQYYSVPYYMACTFALHVLRCSIKMIRSDIQKGCTIPFYRNIKFEKILQDPMIKLVS